VRLRNATAFGTSAEAGSDGTEELSASATAATDPSNTKLAAPITDLNRRTACNFSSVTSKPC